MTSINPSDDSKALRDEIIVELWALVSDEDCAGSAKVAALKEIARLEGVDKPPAKAKNARFRSLADFYGELGGDEASDDEEEESSDESSDEQEA